MEKALLTVTEAAERLSLGRATTYQLVRRGAIPSVRVGRVVRVPVRALDAWVEAQTAGGCVGPPQWDERSGIPPRNRAAP